jgi:hypothetical protein
MHFLTIINHKKHHHNDHIMHGIGASICSGTRSKFSGSQCFIFLCISSLKNTDQYCNKEQISTIIFVVVQTDLLLKIISFLKRQMDQQNEHKTVKKLLFLCKARNKHKSVYPALTATTASNSGKFPSKTTQIVQNYII